MPGCRGLRPAGQRGRPRAPEPHGGQNTALCHLALKITWKRKNGDLYPCGVLKKGLGGVCLENKDFPPLPWAVFGISYFSPVYLFWKITNILEDLALTGEGITFLH